MALLRRDLLLFFLLMPAAASAQEVSGRTISVSISSARSSDRALYLLQRQARSVTRNDCNDAALEAEIAADQAALSDADPNNDSRRRRVRFFVRIDAMEVALGRDASGFYSGSANFTYSCVSR